MLNRFHGWANCVVLAACLSAIGCEDASPIVQAEADQAEADPVAPEQQDNADEASQPPSGEREAGGDFISPEAPAGSANTANSTDYAPGNRTAPAGNRAAAAGGIDVNNANPFANEPRYTGPGAQQGNQGGQLPANTGGGIDNRANTYRPADVGSGKKGRSLENETGVGRMIVTPAVSFFRTRERLAFKVAIPQAMNLYKGTNGHFPKSHRDFMTHIIQFNKIQLPELPEGQRYIYDPKTSQLMVEYPQGAGN